MKVVVVGAGFAGACVAWMLRESAGASVTLVERSPVAGGMLRTHRTAGGVAYEYGPRVVSVFRGDPRAIEFIRRFVTLDERTIYQGTRLAPDWPIVPFPVDRASLSKLPCGESIARELAAIRASGRAPGETHLREYLETSVGPTLTGLAFEGFNRKFWGRRLEDMPAQWGKLRRLERIAEAGAWRLPSVAPHYYPRGGFEPLFERMLDGFDLRADAAVERIDDGPRPVVRTSVGDIAADLVITTGPIDELLGRRHGPLEWRGYRIEVEEREGPGREPLGRAPDGVPFAWLYTPWAGTPVCRTTDFGVIHNGPDAPASGVPSIVMREIADDSVRMYPVWWDDAKLLRYLDDAARLTGVVPLGRLGLYKYTTMDSTYAMARRLVDVLDEYLGAAPSRRLDLLRDVRGDWAN